MSESGRWVSLDQAASFASGGTPSKANPDYWNGVIPWVSAKDMKTSRISDTEDHITESGLENGSRLAPAGATLVLVRGMTLLNDVPICLATRDVAFNRDVKALLAKDGVVSTYLNYAIHSAKHTLLSAVDLAGHGTGKLPTDVFKLVRIRLPGEDEQRAIAHVLGTIDDKIELNRRMNESLEAVARAIFKSWFVDFDPVRAKASSEPAESICRRFGLTPDRLALFPDSFQHSLLGEIPKGWSNSTVYDLAEIVGGGTPDTKEPSFWTDGQHYWATPKDLSKLSTPVLLGTERKVTDKGLTQIGSGLLPQGTVLLSSRAPIGYRAIAEVPVAVNQGFIAMLPRTGVSRYFLLYWTEWAHEKIVSRANGSTFLEISKGSFRPIPVSVPPPDVFAAFDAMIGPIYQRMVSNERELLLLTEERDTLLPQLLSGNVSVPEMEVGS